MATIRHKRSATAGAAPAAGSLTAGELAVNTADGKVFTKRDNGTVVAMALEGHTHAIADVSGLQAAIDGRQPSSANLTALAAVNAVPNQLMFYGVGGWSVLSINPYGQGIIAQGNAEGVRNYISAQQSDATLTALAGVTTAADKLIYATGVDTFGVTDLSAFARALLDDADAATMRGTLGLGSAATAASSAFQAADGDLTAIAALTGTSGILRKTAADTWSLDTAAYLTSVVTANIANSAVTYAKIQNVSAADRLLGRSTAGAGVVEEITCTAAGRNLLDDADAAAQRTTLGLGSLATAGSVATASIDNGAVTYAKIQNVGASSRLLGRATSGAGVVEEITIGSGLSLSGTTLSASGGGGSVTPEDDQIILAMRVFA